MPHGETDNLSEKNQGIVENSKVHAYKAIIQFLLTSFSLYNNSVCIRAFRINLENREESWCQNSKKEY